MASRRGLSRRRLIEAVAVGGLATAAFSACGGSATPSVAPAAPTKPAAAAKPAATPTAAATPATAAASKPAAGGATTGSVPAATFAAPTVSTKFKGSKLKVMMVGQSFPEALQVRLPEFTKVSGIDVELEQLGFAVLNQRADLELSSGSGAYDAMQLIFIRSGRWIGAGWAEDLTPYIEDPTKTDKKELDVEDFVAGAIQPFKRGNSIYALPWLADSQMVVYREDLFKKAGYDQFPATIDEWIKAMTKVEEATKVKGFITDFNLHWIWPNFLMAYGGKFFRNPPDDLHPTFDTPAVKTAARIFADLEVKHTPQGGATQNTAEAQLGIQQGTAASYLDGLGNLQVTLDEKKSRFRDQVRFAKSPSGPAGYFPQLASHGLMINKASKQKDAAWEFLKWATSKEMFLYAALKHNHIGTTRASTLSHPQVKEKFSWHGADVPAMHMAVMERAGSGYMAYRTIPQFPQIGDRVIIALTSIISGQKTAEAAMDELQKDAADILIKSGVKL